MKGFLASFRGRLTVMILALLAVSLTAYSIVVGEIDLSRLSDHINNDLTQRGRMLGRSRPPRDMRGEQPPESGGPPPGAQLRGNPDDVGGFGGPGRPPMGRGRGPAQGGDDLFFGGREPGPNPDLRRARFLDVSGKVVGGIPNDVAFDSDLFSKALNGQEGFSDKVIDGQPVRIFATPWFRPNGDRGVVEVARDLRDYLDLKQTQLWTWLALTPLMLALSALVAFVFSGRALKPIQVMQKAAANIGSGDLNQRLRVSGNDELAELGHTFNIMAANLQRSFEDQKKAYENLREAYESQKRFTADASHELRTPLARLQLATSSALRGPESEYKDALEIADSSAKSMAKLIRELLVLARADAGQLGLKHDTLDLRLVVSDALNGFGREIQASFPNLAVIVSGDQDHLERVVANLVENAVKHTPADKPICVSVDVRGENAILVIEDSGDGISLEHLPHLFERFYRADTARGMGEGVGLGLAICKSVVEGHDGSISVQSEVGKGTRFEVVLPLLKG